MAKDLNKEIEEMAEKMEKATQEPNEKLFSIIKSLGSEGLKAKLPTLSDEEKAVLKAALEEMTLKKAISFDKEAQGAKFVQGNIMDTKIQEDKADDDADEKLVKPEAAKHSHQGTPTDGWEGQVIKAEDEKQKETSMNKTEVIEQIQKSDEAFDQFIAKMMERAEESVVVQKAYEMGMDKKKVQGSIDKFKKKSKSKDEPKEKFMDEDEKEPKMKKSDEDVEKAKKILKEEDQLGDAPEMNEKTMGKKEAAPDIEDNAKASKNAQKDVKNTKIKKSVSWEDSDRLIKANTLGRNFNFNVEHFINETIAKGENKEDLVKSETKEDVNDLIAKSMDRNWDQVNHEKMMAENATKTNGKLVKSFEDNDIAAILGLSEEEAKKILG